MQSLYMTPLHSPSHCATRRWSFIQTCQNAHGVVALTNAISNTAMQKAKMAGLLTATWTMTDRSSTRITFLC